MGEKLGGLAGAQGVVVGGLTDSWLNVFWRLDSGADTLGPIWYLWAQPPEEAAPCFSGGKNWRLIGGRVERQVHSSEEPWRRVERNFLRFSRVCICLTPSFMQAGDQVLA